MTAQEKIEEAEYNLQNLEYTNPMLKSFRFELSNFLNSAQSILYHLLSEYNEKYNLQLKRIDIYSFKETVTKLDNQQAKSFIMWYEQEYNQIKSDKTCGFLVDKRNTNVHKQIVKAVRSIGMDNMRLSIPANTAVTIDINDLLWTGSKKAKVTMTDIDTKEQKQIEMDAFNKTVFNENKELEATTTCRLFLEQLKTLVKEAHEKYP